MPNEVTGEGIEPLNWDLVFKGKMLRRRCHNSYFIGGYCFMMDSVRKEVA